MKTTLIGLLLTALALPVVAQTTAPVAPGQKIVGDSMGRAASPGVKRMGTEFYRRSGDPQNVVRARLDNMPIKTPGSEQEYTILNRHRNESNRYSLPLPDSLRLNPRRRP